MVTYLFTSFPETDIVSIHNAMGDFFESELFQKNDDEIQVKRDKNVLIVEIYW